MWSKYKKLGKYATFRRNTQIVKKASCIIAFPTAESRGIHHSIMEAQRMGKRVSWLTYNQQYKGLLAQILEQRILYIQVTIEKNKGYENP